MAVTILRHRWRSWWRCRAAAGSERFPREVARLTAEVQRLRAEIAQLRAEITELNSQLLVTRAQRNAESARADALLAGAWQFQAVLDKTP